MTAILRDLVEELASLQPPLNVTRRGFVQTSLGAGFAAAVLPVSAQTMITTDTQGLTAGEVKIPAKDGEMPAYRAMPAGKAGLATVLVVSEVFGVHEHIRDVCRRLAKQGYLAVAPELFARLGDASKYTDTGALMREIVSKTSDAQIMGDLDAAAAWAAKNGGGGKLGITGFCWGGRVALMYAAHNPVSRPWSPGMGRLRVHIRQETRRHWTSRVRSRRRCSACMVARMAAFQTTPSTKWALHSRPRATRARSS